MDNERKNLDELFKKHLLNYPIAAPEGAWNEISSRIGKKPARNTFYYFRLAAASVLILIAFGLGYYFALYQNDVIETRQVASSPQKTESINNQLNEKKQIIENQDQKNVKPAQSTASLNTPKKKSFKNIVPDISPVPIPVQIAEKESSEPIINKNAPDNAETIEYANNQENVVAPVQSGISNKIPTEIPPDITPSMDNELLRKMLGFNDSKDDDLVKNKQAGTKWSVGGQLAPMYSYRMIEVDNVPEGTELNESFYNSVEEGITTISSGLNVNYAISDQLAFQTGFYYSRIGQANSDVPIFDDPGSQYLYQLNTSAGKIIINPRKFEDQINITQASPKDTVTGYYSVNSSLVQNFSYIELPFIMKYKLIDHRIGLNVRGGLSPGIMVGNNSYFTKDGDKLSSGITQDVKQVIYNGLVGFGVDIKLNKTLIFNIEPTLRYSLFPVTSGEFIKMRPYSISCFTGISYNF